MCRAVILSLKSLDENVSQGILLVAILSVGSPADTFASGNNPTKIYMTFILAFVGITSIIVSLWLCLYLFRLTNGKRSASAEQRSICLHTSLWARVSQYDTTDSDYSIYLCIRLV